MFARRARAAGARRAAASATCRGSRFRRATSSSSAAGDATPLAAVLEHNRLDLLTLAALTARLLQLVRVGPPDARDGARSVALGRTYARAGLDERARDAYRQRSGSARPPARFGSAAELLALTLRQRGAFDEAAACWRRPRHPRLPAQLIARRTRRSPSTTNTAFGISPREGVCVAKSGGGAAAGVDPGGAAPPGETRSKNDRAAIAVNGYISNVPCTHLRSSAGQVRDDCHRRRFPLLDRCERQESLTAWRDVEITRNSRQRRRRAEPRIAAGCGDGDRHQHAVGRHVQQLSAVTSPASEAAALGRHLPFRGVRRKSLDLDFVASRFVRRVWNQGAVRREASLAFSERGAKVRKRLAAGEREQPQLRMRLRVCLVWSLGVEEELSVGRPVRDYLRIAAVRQPNLGAALRERERSTT